MVTIPLFSSRSLFPSTFCRTRIVSPIKTGLIVCNQFNSDTTITPSTTSTTPGVFVFTQRFADLTHADAKRGIAHRDFRPDSAPEVILGDQLSGMLHQIAEHGKRLGSQQNALLVCSIIAAPQTLVDHVQPEWRKLFHGSLQRCTSGVYFFAEFIRLQCSRTRRKPILHENNTSRSRLPSTNSLIYGWMQREVSSSPVKALWLRKLSEICSRTDHKDAQ